LAAGAEKGRNTGMGIFRLHGDEDGETHLTPVRLSTIDDPGQGVGPVRSLSNIPATTVGVSELTGRMPDYGLHPAPWRQVLVLLQGEYEIETTSGDSHVLTSGDVLITDDLGTKGHYTRDCGTDRLMMVSVRIPDDWDFPVL
jgi:hypothetical protein